MWTAIDRLSSFFFREEGRPPDSAPASVSGRLVKRCRDGSTVEFDRGRFDEWCVYVRLPGQERQAPRDVDYFARLKVLHAQFPRLHDDFVAVFAVTTKVVDALVCRRLSDIAALFPPSHSAEIELLLATLYAAMVAEENRAHAPLGKRIKRLGVHQVLVEGMAVDEAANFSRGKPWRELEQLCLACGF